MSATVDWFHAKAHPSAALTPGEDAMPSGTVSGAGMAAIGSKLLSMVVAAAAIALGVATATPPVRSVDRLDVQRYAGTWYELARVPNKLQANCSSDATTTYRPMADGSMRLMNRCRDAGEHVNVAVARGELLAGDPARMRLSYLPDWLSWWPGSHVEQWVVMVADDYRLAVVSDPSRKSLWILSRTPSIDASSFEAIVSRLRLQRYPVDRLVITPQRGLDEATPFAAKPHLIV
jgi:apolipoprotein D and lipocalin family protein